MNISITPELEKFIAAKVESGMYSSASEVVREGLRLLSEREEHRKQRIAELNREIEIGLDQLARGEKISDIELKAHMKAHKEEFFRKRHDS